MVEIILGKAIFRMSDYFDIIRHSIDIGVECLISSSYLLVFLYGKSQNT